MGATANKPCAVAEMRDFHLTAFVQGFASPIHAAKAAPCPAILPPSKPTTLVATWNTDGLDWDVRDPQLAASLKDFTCDIDFFLSPAAPFSPSKPSAIPASLPMLAEDGVDEWDVRDPQLAASLAGFEFSF
jgi:hypothetical protein